MDLSYDENDIAQCEHAYMCTRYEKLTREMGSLYDEDNNAVSQNINILCGSFDDMSIAQNDDNFKIIISEYMSKITNGELEICCMEDHNVACHFGGYVANKCSICNDVIYAGIVPCKKEMDGCLLTYSTYASSDNCNKDHTIFCYTCSHLNISNENSLMDFYQKYLENKVQREINKGKTMLDNLSDKIVAGWIISKMSDHHECAVKIFSVSNRCLKCFDKYIYVPKDGFMIHQNIKCNYTLPHFFVCSTCMNQLHSFFYSRLVFYHFKKIISAPLAQMLIQFL